MRDVVAVLVGSGKGGEGTKPTTHTTNENQGKRPAGRRLQQKTTKWSTVVCFYSLYVIVNEGPFTFGFKNSGLQKEMKDKIGCFKTTISKLLRGRSVGGLGGR